jgi:beta-mannosidase
MDLGGTWRAAESSEDNRRRATEAGFDDSSWAELPVPGHWRCSEAFAASDGPVLYRRRFSAPRPEDGERAFLVFDGIFYQSDVWVDNDYLGDTEGYFFPHVFEIGGALSRGEEHAVAVEVACPPPGDRTAKRALTGVFQHWDCIDPDWNPGGLWRGVRIERTGPVRLSHLKVNCREATADRAVLDVEAGLDAAAPLGAELSTEVVAEDGTAVAGHTEQQALSGGANVVRWRVFVERPALWWPRALGDQPLHRVTVTVGTGGALSDARSVLTGLRQVSLRNFVATVNAERLFLKGANLGPTRRDLAAAGADDLARDVALAAGAGLDLVRVHGHISRPELYEAADRQGMLVWQDLPLQWGYGNVRRQAVAQARQAVNLLAHHPSIALWCAHNEPVAVDFAPGRALAPRTVARFVAGQALPTWNKTFLDRSVARALSKADGSRAVVAHSGVVPHPAWGTDSHFYFGWYHGEERDFPRVLSALPVTARFVSEFGAQAVPDSADFMGPEEWPNLDWERLERHHCLQRGIFERRVPPGDFPGFDEWRNATQEYQATVLRFHIETLRRLKYRPTGGFCFFMLADAQPAVTWSVLDHQRVPKAAYRAVADACAPVVFVADRPAAEYRPGELVNLALHAVSDLRSPLGPVTAEVAASWPGGGGRWRFSGDLPADSCVRVGRVSFAVPADAGEGLLELRLALRWEGGEARNRYASRVVR